MSSIILISASIILSSIISILLFKKIKQLSPQNGGSKSFQSMSKEESIKYISQKADLTDEESVGLEVLFELVSSIRLYTAFEDEEISKKWLITSRRAITKSEQFDPVTKEELEYTAYEIHRKINNQYHLMHPSVKHISDVTLGQIMSLKISDKIKIQGELIDTNFHSLSVLVTTPLTISSLKLIKKQVYVSLWKIMDACYGFNASINTVEKNKQNNILHLSVPREISCIQIREYPRQNTEIPIKCRQGILSTDTDTGALQESFSGVSFGIVNDIGSRGCSIISHLPIPENTILIIEIPLFNQIYHIKGIIRTVINHSEVFTLHMEFHEDTPKSIILKIYHYIFAENTSN